MEGLFGEEYSCVEYLVEQVPMNLFYAEKTSIHILGYTLDINTECDDQ